MCDDPLNDLGNLVVLLLWFICVACELYGGGFLFIFDTVAVIFRLALLPKLIL